MRPDFNWNRRVVAATGQPLRSKKAPGVARGFANITSIRRSLPARRPAAEAIVHANPNDVIVKRGAVRQHH